ncbi:MAG: hypothetical protein ACP5D2_02425, partial [Candidatus Nanoarchaeia archaeon]
DITPPIQNGDNLIIYNKGGSITAYDDKIKMNKAEISELTGVGTMGLGGASVGNSVFVVNGSDYFAEPVSKLTYTPFTLYKEHAAHQVEFQSVPLTWGSSLDLTGAYWVSGEAGQYDSSLSSDFPHISAFIVDYLTPVGNVTSNILYSKVDYDEELNFNDNFILDSSSTETTFNTTGNPAKFTDNVHIGENATFGPNDEAKIYYDGSKLVIKVT